MMLNLLIYLHIFLIVVSTIHTQQFQWILLSDGSSMDTPPARRDAALGFDQTFLILFGGRTQTGTPLQDCYSFNILTGQWDVLTFPAPPSARYGMATASLMNNGLYMLGGFGFQSSWETYSPYTSFGGSGQDVINYNYATPPNFIQNPTLLNNPSYVNNPNYNPMSGTGYDVTPNEKYVNNDDRDDEGYHALKDAWLLSYTTKTWQQISASEYGRGFGSAAAASSPNGAPKILYSMGKAHSWMYSIVENIGPGSVGLSQPGNIQSSIILYDLPSFSPAYPHARYGHSTTLLTDNHLLLYGGCLSGYGKGGPCPSKDTWLLTIDKGNWERLGECPPTKTGATMVTIPSYTVCSAMGQNAAEQTANMGAGAESPIAVLWSGRESNPSSIRTYPSPRDEIAVFSLSQKEWHLKRAAPSPTDGSYPMQREGAGYVAGCFQGAPGMFVFGGRATADRRVLSDLWFLQVSPQDALNAPNTRGCVYPFSYYHLHGIFQFFTYGIIFPIGYFVGRFAENLVVRRRIHMSLQLFGVALAICGFSFGVYSVRAPAWLHFRHAHAVLGIIIFILTIFQFFIGLFGAIFVKKRLINNEYPNDSQQKIDLDRSISETWAGEGAWRLVHRFLGLFVLLLGLINISLGVFLAVLPLPVWVIWYIWFSILIIAIIALEISLCIRQSGFNRGRSIKLREKREDPKGTSQASLKYSEEPLEQPTTSIPIKRRNPDQLPPLEPTRRDYRPSGVGNGSISDEKYPLISNHNQTRPFRTNDVNTPASLPQYDRTDMKGYPLRTKEKNEYVDSADAKSYTGYSPEHEQALPRPSTQQQGEYNLTRVRLQ